MSTKQLVETYFVRTSIISGVFKPRGAVTTPVGCSFERHLSPRHIQDLTCWGCFGLSHFPRSKESQRIYSRPVLDHANWLGTGMAALGAISGTCPLQALNYEIAYICI